MTTILIFLAALSLLIWLYLLALRGGFWRLTHRLEAAAAELTDWPAVVALIPARNEADVIERSLASILAQDYRGPFHVIVIDDQSDDATAARASAAAALSQRSDALSLLSAPDLPDGWAGKLWALSSGREAARAQFPEAEYLWLSDADIAEPTDMLRRLVAKAETEKLDLVSIMVALSCQGFWERLLIPPFILFFQKLYPFAWVADRDHKTAAAAGGCVLVSAETLDRAGGFAAIKGALIDDCSLAAAIKKEAVAAGRGIWLGLSREAISLRPYQGLAGIWQMVARSAYTQLRHSLLLLLGTAIAMTITYLLPPFALLIGVLQGSFPLAGLGLLTWALMALSAWPVTRYYDLPGWQALSLPLAAGFYLAMTVDSARQHWLGRGGDWKGRVQGERLAAGGRGR